jgi:hypothetical protein
MAKHLKVKVYFQIFALKGEASTFWNHQGLSRSVWGLLYLALKGSETGTK